MLDVEAQCLKASHGRWPGTLAWSACITETGFQQLKPAVRHYCLQQPFIACHAELPVKTALQLGEVPHVLELWALA